MECGWEIATFILRSGPTKASSPLEVLDNQLIMRNARRKSQRSGKASVDQESPSPKPTTIKGFRECTVHSQLKSVTQESGFDRLKVMSNLEVIAGNLRGIRLAIEAACVRANRSPESVQLVAVTKYAELEWVRDLVELGETQLGESRPQQLCHRVAELAGDVRWHMIGHLQRNKVDMVVPAAELIHSVDSLRLLRKIESSAAAVGKRSRILLEVNVSGEDSKDGFTPEELRSHWQEILDLKHVDVQGLMTMAPHSDQAESARQFFRQLRELRDELAARSESRLTLPELSMGMSGDFEVAIEEGATLIRIGSRIFDGLSRPE
jgi:PLP dependent protein